MRGKGKGKRAPQPITDSLRFAVVDLCYAASDWLLTVAQVH